MLVAPLVLGAMLLAPPTEADPSELAELGPVQAEAAEGIDESESPESDSAAPSAATHGLLDIRVYERGTRDGLGGASLFLDGSPEAIAETDERGRVEVWIANGSNNG